MNVDELHRWLDHHHPVVDIDGVLRAEIIGAKRRRVRWVTWEQAAQLCSAHAGMVAFICFAPPALPGAPDDAEGLR